MNDRKRAVITGMGAMTPLALNLEETWEGLLAGRSGVGPITQIDASPFPSRIAGELPSIMSKLRVLPTVCLWAVSLNISMPAPWRMPSAAGSVSGYEGGQVRG